MSDPSSPTPDPDRTPGPRPDPEHESHREPNRKPGPVLAGSAGAPPVVTWIALGLMIYLYVASFGGLIPTPEQVLGLRLMLSGEEVWSGYSLLMLAAPFLHAGPIHLFCCASAFLMLGTVVERVLGHKFMFGTLFFGALFSSGLQLAAGPLLGMGASALVFALFGVLLTGRRAFFEFQIALATPPIRRLWVWLAGFTVLGLLPAGYDSAGGLMTYWGVGNVAQAAGLVFGMAVGWLAGGEPLRLTRAYAVFVTLAVFSILGATWVPWSSSWQLLRFHREIRQREYQAAVQRLERYSERHSDRSLSVLNALAWTRATAHDASVRDGQAAIALAREGLNASSWQEPAVIDTLAAAYAEAGDWERALATQQLALDALRRFERINRPIPQLSRQLEDNLRRIQNREPIRE